MTVFNAIYIYIYLFFYLLLYRSVDNGSGFMICLDKLYSHSDSSLASVSMHRNLSLYWTFSKVQDNFQIILVLMGTLMTTIPRQDRPHWPWSLCPRHSSRSHVLAPPAVLFQALVVEGVPCVFLLHQSHVVPTEITKACPDLKSFKGKLAALGDPMPMVGSSLKRTLS